MDFFVDQNSVVRRIWGRSDTILFIFAGAAAEFALNKAVDWLYFTGKLPADPLGRLFSTVEYARAIVFSEKPKAFATIDAMAAIHKNIEKSRGSSIPDWAYRDVLFMLIDYSIRSFELLERPLSPSEKEEVFNIFNQVGICMRLRDLPSGFEEWLRSREEHLNRNLIFSMYTRDLFLQYKKHLGASRYFFLKEAQILVLPDTVRNLLGFRKNSLLRPVVAPYHALKKVNLEWIAKSILLPGKYKERINRLDIEPV